MTTKPEIVDGQRVWPLGSVFTIASTLFLTPSTATDYVLVAICEGGAYYGELERVITKGRWNRKYYPLLKLSGERLGVRESDLAADLTYVSVCRCPDGTTLRFPEEPPTKKDGPSAEGLRQELRSLRDRIDAVLTKGESL